MKQMNYGLLMRRVMAQLALSAGGATQSLEARTSGASYDAKILSGPALLRATHCHNCQRETDGKRQCPHCGTEPELVYVSVYWLQEQWWKAHTTRRQAALVGIALSTLRLSRIRVKPKHDTATVDGRLAVGREALRDGVAKVASHYGYSRSSIYDWMDQARRLDARAADAKARKRASDYTLSERSAIAMTLGSSRAVAAEFGVGRATVQRWRLAHSLEGGQNP